MTATHHATSRSYVIGSLPPAVAQPYVLPMAHLQVFGAAGIHVGTRTLGPGKAVALLAYLAATPTLSARRKEAFHLLYSDDTPRDADAFRQLIASLRKLLPGTFVASGDLIQLSGELSSDRQAFVDAIARGNHDAAFDLYVAEFFEAFEESGCDGFRRWAHEERLRLRRRFEFAAECVVRRHLANADWTAALATAYLVAERFPTHLISARLLIETLLLSGRAGDIRSILSELGATRVTTATSPQPRALDLFLDAVTALAREHGLADPRRPLIGRDDQFRTLLEAWNAARAGSGATLVISGEAGIGKSRLLNNLALRLRLETPSLVGPIRAAQTESACDQIVQHLARSILPLPGALGTTPQHYLVLKRLSEGSTPGEDASEERRISVVVDALGEGLRAASEEAPVVVLIDEPGPPDGDAVRILADISARLRNARVLLVVASRHSLTRAIETSTREQLTLSRLDARETGIMVSCASDTLTAADAEIIHAATDGVPGRVLAAIDSAAQSTNVPTHAIEDRTRDTVTTTVDVPLAAQRRTWYRRPLSQLIPIGAIGAAALLVASQTFGNARVASPPESFTVFTWQHDSVSRESFVIGDDDSTALTPRFTTDTRVTRWPFSRVPDRVRVSPDGETIAVQIETEGPNTMDLMAVRGDSTFELVTGEGDDGTPDWSPDGGMLAFSTNRWSDTGNDACDIAIRSATGVWRATSGPDCDIGPRWTPDGLGLAFLRQYRARSGRTAICSLPSLDGTPTCIAVDSSLHGAELIGWRSATSLLYAASTDTSSSIYELDITRGESRPKIVGLTFVEAELSPSRDFIACWCSIERDSVPRITLFDLNGGRPLYARDVAPDAPFRHIAWHGRSELLPESLGERETLLRRLHSTTMASAQAVRAADTLAAARAEMRKARAAIEKAASAMVLPQASVDSTPFSVSASRQFLDERWTSIDTARWVPFGVPRPQASSAIGGLDPGGDGNYLSGLYLRAPFIASHGFVLEARVSIPVTLPYWQGITIVAESEEYARALRTWSHRKGTWPVPATQRFFESGIQYPGIEGPERATRITLLGAGGVSSVPISPRVGDGREVVLRVEYAADSTMRLFANGLQVGRRRYAPTHDGRYRLFVYGHSVESAVRVRRLRGWALDER